MKVAVAAAAALALTLAVASCAPAPETTSSQDLRPGDCFDGTLDSVGAAPGEVATIWVRTAVPTIACDQPHSSQVVHVTEPRTWADDEARQTCTQAAEDYTRADDRAVVVNASYLGGAETRPVICCVTAVGDEPPGAAG